MILTLSFAEISAYVKSHYNQNLALSKVSDKEICISYERRILIKTIKIPVNISIDSVTADSVTVVYNGGMGIDMIISGALSFMKSRLPELVDAIIPGDGHKVRIELSKLPQTKSLVKVLAPDDILILDNAIRISASLY